MNRALLWFAALSFALTGCYSSLIRVFEDKDTWLNEEEAKEHSVRAFALPVIAKIELHKAFDFFLGPDVRIGRRDGARWRSIGGHVGVAIGAYRYVSIVPECAFTFVVAGAEDRAPDPGAGDYYGDRALARGDKRL